MGLGFDLRVSAQNCPSLAKREQSEEEIWIGTMRGGSEKLSPSLCSWAMWMVLLFERGCKGRSMRESGRTVAGTFRSLLANNQIDQGQQQRADFGVLRTFRATFEY